MYHRFLKYTKSNSFFLFGPRGTGKTTWLKQTFNPKKCLWFDLLEAEVESRLSRDPDMLIKQWLALKVKPEYVVVDEIQKNPKLLDVVHKAIEEHKIKFILTGSSARKLKRGSANMLAGRAFDFYILPFSYFEITKDFDLLSSLQFGLLPKIFSEELKNNDDKIRYLYSYVSVYLKEEILIEQLVRQLEPFRKFLEIAAQMNGQIINYAKIGRDAGIDPKQVERYFPILIDTLIGFYLEPYHASVRKRQTAKSKFYFFDSGVCRALENKLNYSLNEQTVEYGKCFEHFIILEFFKMNISTEKRYKLSFLRVNDNQEVDLVVEAGQRLYFIEIKSYSKVNLDDVKKLLYFKNDFPKAKLILLSCDQTEFVHEGVECRHWKNVLVEFMNLKQ